MENDNPQVPIGDLPILNFIRQKYVPASPDTATIRLTTQEIGEEIRQHTGDEVSTADTYGWLTDNGYTYDTVGDMRFEWLLKEAE